MDSAIYLDFGGALTAIGLLFAVYQLRRPSWDVVLRLRPWWQRALSPALAILGAISALIAILLDHFKPCWGVAWLTNPFWYQVLAYACFALSPTLLLILSTRKQNLFNARSAERFYRVLGWHVASTGERVAILDVLLANFHIICKFAVSLNSGKARDYARSILEVILSDDVVVKELTTNRLAMLDHIFAVADEYGLSRYQAAIGVSALVKNLFFDQSSFLYKQYRSDGLALAMNIYDRLFGSPRLLSNFELFGYRAVEHTSRQEIGETGLDVFVESLGRSIKTYLSSGQVPPENINSGIEYLSKAFGNRCMRVALEGASEETRPRTPAWWEIYRISHFFGHDLLYLVDEGAWDSRIRNQEAGAPGDGFASQLSISAAIAEALCEALSSLASVGRNADFEQVYQTVIDLLHGLAFTDTLIVACYREKFTEAIWERIKTNIVRRWFPATLRVYLSYVGFALVFERDLGKWVESQRERMRRLLYVDLLPLLEKDERMINGDRMEDALLPSSMRLKDGRFWYRGGFGKGAESEITPPPHGSPSALEGVMDDHDRWEEKLKDKQ